MSCEFLFVIYGVIVVNVVIVVIKFIVVVIIGSLVMLFEVVYFFVDIGNGLLLFWGLYCSCWLFSVQYFFGYGYELYFWSFIVVVLIFGLGGGVLFYEGVIYLCYVQVLCDLFWNYVVLVVVFVFEGVSFMIVWCKFCIEVGEWLLWQVLWMSKDLFIYIVFVEDVVVLIGLLIVGVGIVLVYVFGCFEIDGFVFIFIGLLLVGVVVLFVCEVCGLLVGEGVQFYMVVVIMVLVCEYVEVIGMGLVCSMYLGFDEVLFILDLQFVFGVSVMCVVEVVDVLCIVICECYFMLM